MFSKIHISILLALLLTVVVAIPTLAGGWAVITLDELPSHVVAGEPLTIGFTVLQHGRTPMGGLDPTVSADSGVDQFVVDAQAESAPGHYAATLTFPKEGDWNWTIQAFTMLQPMPVLRVMAASDLENPSPAIATTPVRSLPWMRIVAIIVFGLGIVGTLVAYRQKSRLIWASTALCLLVGISLFLAESASASMGNVQNTLPPDASMEQVELGKQLFIAKGCITCHFNDRTAKPSEYWTVEIGAPNLTTYSSSPDLLRARLKDPASVKSDTQMPKLTLSDPEIDALIAFINSK